MSKLCGMEKELTGIFCTREPSHTGDHIATIGPYQEALTELARWPRESTQQTQAAAKRWQQPEVIKDGKTP